MTDIRTAADVSATLMKDTLKKSYLLPTGAKAKANLLHLDPFLVSCVASS